MRATLAKSKLGQKAAGRRGRYTDELRHLQTHNILKRIKSGNFNPYYIRSEYTDDDLARMDGQSLYHIARLKENKERKNK